MPYVTSIERLAKAEGLKEGLEEGLKEGLHEGIVLAQESIILALETKFGRDSRKLARHVKRINEVKLLRALKDKIGKAHSLAEVREQLS